jgi:hypothetical protein
MNILELVHKTLKENHPDLLDHLTKNDLGMAAAFSPFFITLCIYKVPLKCATRIFEAFMVEGETALLNILFRMLEYKKEKIMEMGDELLEYLRMNIIVECI